MKLLYLFRFSKLYEPYWLVLILLIGAFLRFYGLGSESFSLDELDTILLVHDLTVLEIIDTGKAPFYFLCEYIWVRIFGYSEIGARSLNALVGSVSILLMYMVGKELFNRRIGLISSYFFSVSTFLINHSQTIRYYSFMVLFALVSVYLYLMILKKNKFTYYLIFCIISILSFYNHYLAILLIAAFNFHFLVNWNRLQKYRMNWIICQACILVLTVPRLLKGLFKTTAGEAAVMKWVKVPEIISPLKTFIGYIGDILISEQGIKIFNSSISIIYIAILYLILSTFIYIYIKGYKNLFNQLLHGRGNYIKPGVYWNEITLVIIWLITPILILMLISYYFHPVYVDRYTSVSAPALYILIALIIYRIKHILPEPVLIGFVSIIIFPGLLHYYSEPQKHQYRESAYYLEQHTGPEDLVVLIGYGRGRKFLWYYRGNAELCRLKTKTGINAELEQHLLSCVEDRSEFWVVKTPAEAGFGEQFLNYLENQEKFLPREKIGFRSVNIYRFSKGLIRDG